MSLPPPYAEWAPPVALAPWVAAFWAAAADPHPLAAPRRILPDGSLDVIVTLAAGGAPAARVVGAMRRAALVRPAPGTTAVGVRFRPGAAASFLPLPLHELTDQAVPLEWLWPESMLAEQLATAVDMTARLRGFERALLDRLRTAPRPHPLTAAAVAAIEQARGRVAVAALAASLGVGERRLERLFAREVGLAPKVLARVARFQRVRALIRQRPAVGGSWLAAEAGYADQAHLVHEFTQLAGVPPAAYARERDARGGAARRPAGGRRAAHRQPSSADGP